MQTFTHHLSLIIHQISNIKNEILCIIIHTSNIIHKNITYCLRTGSNRYMHSYDRQPCVCNSQSLQPAHAKLGMYVNLEWSGCFCLCCCCCCFCSEGITVGGGQQLSLQTLFDCVNVSKVMVPNRNCIMLNTSTACIRKS
jgi:hypothetical protein